MQLIINPTEYLIYFYDQWGRHLIPTCEHVFWSKTINSPYRLQVLTAITHFLKPYEAWVYSTSELFTYEQHTQQTRSLELCIKVYYYKPDYQPQTMKRKCSCA